MNDSVYRQAAINALCCECQGNCIPCDSFPCGEVEAIQKLPSADVPHWIPCSEQLPKEDGQYLITVKYKHVNNNYEDVYAEHGEWYDGRWDMFCFGHCGEVEDIIAWMPLPEPYKENSNG